MKMDRENFLALQAGEGPPTLRLFRFAEPTITIGRSQDTNDLTNDPFRVIARSVATKQSPAEAGGGEIASLSSFARNDGRGPDRYWPIVRRPTGGGAVLHENDLCLSLIWRLGEPPLPRSLRESYQWIHRTIQRALRPLGIETFLHRNPVEGGLKRPGVCFQEPICDDLADASGRKIVGGAQARGRRCALYQGSIQLQHSHLENALLTAFSHAL